MCLQKLQYIGVKHGADGIGYKIVRVRKTFENITVFPDATCAGMLEAIDVPMVAPFKTIQRLKYTDFCSAIRKMPILFDAWCKAQEPNECEMCICRNNEYRHGFHIFQNVKDAVSVAKCFKYFHLRKQEMCGYYANKDFLVMDFLVMKVYYKNIVATGLEYKPPAYLHRLKGFNEIHGLRDFHRFIQDIKNYKSLYPVLPGINESVPMEVIVADQMYIPSFDSKRRLPTEEMPPTEIKNANIGIR